MAGAAGEADALRVIKAFARSSIGAIVAGTRILLGEYPAMSPARRQVMFILLLLFSKGLHAQVMMDTAAIRLQLNALFERDQRIRKSDDSASFRSMIDSSNLAQVETLIAKYGWMGKSVIGSRGNYTLWLIIQHAPLEKQEQYLPLMEKSVAEGESRPADFAYLKDRVLMRQGKKQLYGTQVIPGNSGLQEFWPIEDEANVNKRRMDAGLEPIETYAGSLVSCLYSVKFFEIID